MLYGVSYYHEYQPFDRLEEDARMMREAGINYARLGDSIWSLCEPSEGDFRFDWLRRVLDVLHENGIRVVLVTPTYAIPPWLWRRHPEVMRQGADGHAVPFGARQNMDVTNPTYRHYAERITRELLSRYAGHPSVIGFQVDNETGTGFAQNPAVVDAFRERLKAKYGSVDALNEIWGLTYWSHRLGDWADLWPPAGNTSPGYDLEWRRFNASLTTEFLVWQAGIVREYARDDQFVIQDLVGMHGRDEADRYQIAEALDVNAENFPHATQDCLAHPPVEGNTQYPATTLGAGPAQLYQRSDLAYGAKRSNFFVTEMNPISIAGSDNIFPCYDGQWRQAAFACISRGADLIAYWHWHSLHYGHEIYSHGILNHDLEPNRNYDEVASIGRDLRAHGELLTGLRPDAEVAFVYSYDSRYALACQPCLKKPSGEKDPRSYQTIFDGFYRAFFDARAQSIVLPPSADLSDFPVVVAPALYVAPEETLAGLVRYASAGGHLVLTFRSGYADEYARARWSRGPGPLREPAWVGYNLYSHLASPVPVLGAGGLSLPAGASAVGWVDELVPEAADTDVLATYDHPHFGRFPAVTSRAYGAGRITYVGTLPDPAFGSALAGWVLRSAGVSPAGAGLPESVRVTRATARDGRRLAFVANWSFESHVLDEPPASGTLLFSGEPVGERLELGPWDFQVVVES